MIGPSQGCVKEEGEQHWVGVVTEPGEAWARCEGQSWVWGPGQHSPLEHLHWWHQGPWQLPMASVGSCSMSYWTVQTQELRTFRESLHPLKCRFPPWCNSERPPDGALPRMASTTQVSQRQGDVQNEDKIHTAHGGREPVSAPGPHQRRGPRLSLPHTCQTPSAGDVPGGTIRRGTNLVGMATRKPAWTSTRSLCWRKILF